MSTPGQRPEPVEPDAERVLSQALRAMAGGRENPSNGGSTTERAAGGRTSWSTAQVVLLALLVGLAIGMGAGIISLLV